MFSTGDRRYGGVAGKGVPVVSGVVDWGREEEKGVRQLAGTVDVNRWRC